MLPKQPIKYPEFVADQLLTADNLNDLFGYLNEEGRLTRTNLIGIGIVCGLEVKMADNGKSVTITKGVGVTSEGYLVEIPETTFEEYKSYNALKEHVYDRFATGDPAKQVFQLDELIVKSSVEGATLIDKNFLQDKIVLLFVELLRKDAKNCDPDSCDDKGVNVTVTFRPLVVSTKEDISGLLTGAYGINGFFGNQCNELPVVPLPRFDVPATKIASTADIIAAYQSLIKPDFLKQIEGAVTALYNVFLPFLKDLYTKSGYEGFTTEYSFLQDTKDFKHLVCIQYYYDLISDILATYEELRNKGNELLAECCPDSSLFPRHLLLGPATGNYGAVKSGYRHYFIPSPAFHSCKGLVGEIRLLYGRLVLLRQLFNIPEIEKGNEPDKVPVRITPSMLGRYTLSEKAIPYYYEVPKNNFSLLQRWNYKLTRQGKENRNLSYHALSYPVQYPEVTDPLRFDLEPYNFFRIEGIIGKNYKKVMRSIRSEISESRLPFEVIALKAGSIDKNLELPEDFDCYFDDLAISYEIVRREWEAIVGQTIDYLEQNEKQARVYIDTNGQNILTPYLESLYNAKKFLYDELMDFVSVHTAFMNIYDFIENTAMSIRTRIFRLLETPTAHNQVFDEAFAEDLIDHFDAIILNCEKGALRSIYQQYARKASELYQKLFLSDFLKEHPGIQHKAGVPIGGTFIIVYNHNVRKRTQQPPVSGNDFPQAIAAVPDSTPEVAVIATVNKVPEQELYLLNQLKRALPPDQQELLEKYIPARGDREASGLDELILDLDDGMVIADFFVPYSCCDGCSSIKFVVSDAPPLEHLLINIDEKTFCNDDKGAYKISGTPAGGNFKGEGIKEQDGSFTFNPSAVHLDPNQRQKQVVITYSKEGARPAIVTLTVFAKPKASFEIEPPKQLYDAAGKPIPIVQGEYNGMVYFKDTSTNADKVSWDFGDGSPLSNSHTPKYHFNNKAGTYKVTLTVTNGSCKDVISRDVKIVATTISLEKNEFCNNDENSYKVKLYPEGYTPGGEGLININGAWVFRPAAVNFYEANKKITLSYAVGGQEASFDLTVYYAVNPDPSISETGEPMTYSFMAYAQYAQKMKWDFGDGNTSDEMTPVHTYKEPGTYIVKLTAWNGACFDDTVTSEVDVVKPPVKVCSPAKDIIAEFGNIKTINADQFKSFTANFASYKEIDSLFKALPAVIATTEAEQIKYFIEYSVSDHLKRWLAALDNTIRSSNSGTRNIPLALYSVLLQLTMYIACIQKKDVNVAEVKTAEIFIQAQQGSSYNAGLGWGPYIYYFTAEEKARLKTLAQRYKSEQSQTEKNGEQDKKAYYVQLLEQCYQALKLLNVV